MRKILLTSMVLSSLTAYSAESFKIADVAREAQVSESKARVSTQPVAANKIVHGNGFSVQYSPTTRSAYEVGGANSEKGSYNSDGSYGVGLRFSNASYKDFDFSWGVNLEIIRNYNSTTVNGAHQAWPSSYDVNVLSVDPSITYGITSDSYAFAGFNYAFPATGTIFSTHLEADWGYQFGGGYRFNNAWHIEALYRQLNFKASLVSSAAAAKTITDYDKFQYAGLMVRAVYTIQ